MTLPPMAKSTGASRPTQIAATSSGRGTACSGLTLDRHGRRSHLDAALHISLVFFHKHSKWRMDDSTVHG